MLNINQMQTRLMKCGLSGSEAKQIMTLIDNWVKCSGSEWTVSHLKLIKQTVIALYGNYPNGVSPYIRTKNGMLSGPFRAIQRLFVTGQKKALTAMLIYTSWVARHLTKRQSEKFTDACTSPPYTGTRYPDVTNLGLSKTKLPSINFTSRPFGSYVDGTRCPDHRGRSFPATDTQYSALSFQHTKLYRDIYMSTGSFMPEDADYYYENLCGFTLGAPLGLSPIGKVSVIQEPGLKARFIANPNRMLQHMLQPLGDYLFSCLRACAWDCTFDQSKPLTVVSEKLKSGHKVHCYDLSNATDLYPLEVQIEHLLQITRNDDRREEIYSSLRLFVEASRSVWFFGKSTIQWTRGQPLGLYPSFPMFALSHGLFIFEILVEAVIDDIVKQRSSDYEKAVRDWDRGTGLCAPKQPCLDRTEILSELHQMNVKCTETLSVFKDQFFVLGDDVVILNDTLAIKYEALMSDLGVKINKSKSIISDLVAEFAGELILRDRVYSPFKWRLVSWDSIVPFLKHWGWEGIQLLPRHLREWATIIASLPEPVGLGYNPKGWSLEFRLCGLIDLYLNNSLPALTEVNEGLADVLRAMPAGSSLSYFPNQNMVRPVPIPFKKILDVLTPMDVKAFFEDLIDTGVVTRDEALDEVHTLGFRICDDIKVRNANDAAAYAEKRIKNRLFALTEYVKDKLTDL